MKEAGGATVAAGKRGTSGLRSFRYEHKPHARLPHVVKFSGGRSSGMLLLLLLEKGVLDARRGDVIIFNNTSAEHPATYEFAARCKELAESEYDMPFFWLEFQTYEDVERGMWTRKSSYRLVNASPYSSQDNPGGYRSRGEVFEEMLSQQSFVPNQHSRTCTALMKIQTTEEFLRDWFAVKPEIGHCGHYYGKSMMTIEAVEELHRRNGGGTPKEVLAEKKRYVMACPPERPAQKFADFTAADISVTNPELTERGGGGRAHLSGDDCVEHLLFIGIRGDEPRRVAKMRGRNRDELPGRESGGHEYAPLAETWKLGREDVNRFWRSREWGLQLPYDRNLSNCVFCFLKGAKNLAALAAEQRKIGAPEELSPANIAWWVKMEQTYGRDLVREERNVRSRDGRERAIIGFFGLNARTSFERIAELAKSEIPVLAVDNREALPCDCTD